MLLLVVVGLSAAFLAVRGHAVIVPRVEPMPGASSTPSEPSLSVAGYGRGSVGGTGGQIITVQNLNDAGRGSLREALSAPGPRIVRFAVDGTITLTTDLIVSEAYLTLEGQSAPGAGVQLRGGHISIRAHDVILRYMRLRPGDEPISNAPPADTDGLTLDGQENEVYNVVLDHLTMIWGPDIGGLAVLDNVHDVTVQNSIMGDGLYLSRHPEGIIQHQGHSMAANATQLVPEAPWPRRLTYVHNLFTTAAVRVPRFEGTECTDVVNNVIYDWGRYSAHGNPRSLNLVNNWFRSGPETTRFSVWQVDTNTVNTAPFPASVYEKGNVTDGFSYARDPNAVYTDSPPCALSVTPTSADTAYKIVLADVGATLPVRDAVDARIVSNVVNRVSQGFFNGVGQPSPNPSWPRSSASPP